MSNGKHILFGAGGTGGHLYPAISVANEIKKIDSSIRITFTGRADKIESRVVPQYCYDFVPIEIYPPNLKANLRTFLFPFKLIRAIEKCKSYISENNVDIVVCAGAYISIPPGIASKRCRKKLALMESNINPGKAIKFLFKRSDVLFTSFEQTSDFFSSEFKSKIVYTGNPVRDTFLNMPERIKSREKFGIYNDNPTLLVFGGSLGAESINRAMSQIINQLLELELNIIWQTGDKHIIDAFNKPNLKVMPYIDNMAEAFSAADLIISRSGATTVAELTVSGKPSILIPLPTASTGEQQKNADFMQKIGASVIISDSMLNSNLFEAVKDIIFDIQKLAQMGNNAIKYGKPDAAVKIANIIYNMIND